jgi:hypothetical protein
LQSVVEQHSVDGMHELSVEQKVSPVGQLHDPPGPEQCPPAGQSVSVQHWPCEMHELNGGLTMVQTVPLLGQTQLPPGPVHCSPVTRQSLLSQHELPAMHELLTVQTLFVPVHAQMAPGAAHVSPVTVQSAVWQHEVLGMHELLATHPL